MSALGGEPRAVRRIGHKGADHIAPGNTLASFDAALEHGCDMVEFDVLPERGADGRRTGRLVLAHDYEDAGKRTPITLEEGLAHFASDAYAGVELDVDLKLPGYEQRVVDALRERKLDDRAIVSTMEAESLVTIREIAPELRLGWSVPKVRRDYLASPFTKPLALAALQVVRRVMPGRAAREIRAGRIDALMSHWVLVTPRLVTAVAQAGGGLYVWTVDDARRIAALEQLGVTGVITNDPRLFGESG